MPGMEPTGQPALQGPAPSPHRAPNPRVTQTSSFQLTRPGAAGFHSGMFSTEYSQLEVIIKVQLLVWHGTAPRIPNQARKTPKKAGSRR